MCGVYGVDFRTTGRPASPELLHRMGNRIIHRGPDDEGSFVDGPLGLGMRRLSIIDLSSGSQPIFNEEGTVAVVFNGEIYNFQELRADLILRGHVFKTNSDTEVIVHLYEEEGIEFPRRLNGMFGIALWDSRRRRLMLVRDRLGVKPLYYAQTQSGLAFGSELKCLTELDDLPRRLDREAVYHYFTLGYIPHPYSIYRDVRQLPPAHRLIRDDDKTTIDRYWSLPTSVDATMDETTAGEELERLVLDAVRLRMISDVPIGAFLSGGLDSSIAVALMAEQSSRPIRTFFIDFDDPRYSEKEFARAMARRYQTDHHELVVRPDEMQFVDELTEMFDEPFGDSSAIPTYHVSQLTRRHVTVALAGDGGDESFGGYSRYRQILKRRSLPRLVREGLGVLGRTAHRAYPARGPGRRTLRSIGMSSSQFYAVGSGEIEARELLSSEFIAGIPQDFTWSLLRPDLEHGDPLDPLSPYATLDLQRYLPDDILTKVDRTSMACSLEVRAPFLDYRIVELAARMPSRWKLNGSDSKLILKKTFGARLPAEVLAPRKRGFSVPLSEWFRGELRPLLEESIRDPDLRAAGIFDTAAVAHLAREHWDGIRDRKSQLWWFLIFARWWKRFGGSLSEA